MMLGNLTPDEIEQRLNIKLSSEHKKQLTDTWQPQANNIAKDKWHCFDIPFCMVCGCQETAEKFRDIFLTYDLSKATAFQITLVSNDG